MLGESARGANRGSGRVQSAPGEPSGWSPGAERPLIPAAGRNSALENLRSVISVTYLPLAISALVIAAGTMGMVHPVLLTQMLVVACGVPALMQLLRKDGHVLTGGIRRRISTTSASEFHYPIPLFPWGEWGSLHGAAPSASAAVSAGASPADRAVAGKTGEKSGRGGSRTTANGQLCAIPSPGTNNSRLNHPPYISELH
jgi:hypothetical protein